MFIVRNALHNVVRNKGRNALMIIIVAIITAAATVALAIVQAAESARTSALDDTTISAQISIDRGAMIEGPRRTIRRRGHAGHARVDGQQAAHLRRLPEIRQIVVRRRIVVLHRDNFGSRRGRRRRTGGFQRHRDKPRGPVDRGTEPVRRATQAPGDGHAGGMPDAGGGKGGMMMTTGDFSLVGVSPDEAIANAPQPIVHDGFGPGVRVRHRQ